MEMSKRALTVLIVLLSLAFGAAAVWGLRAQSVDASPGGSGSPSASASASASSSSPEGTPADSGTLDGTWKAKDASKAPIDLVKPVTLTFADGKVTAETGCNKITGTVKVDNDGAMTTSGLSDPKVTCPPPLAAQQAWIRAMLEAGAQADVSGDDLTLSWTQDADYSLGLVRDNAS